jgi:hypothetical protein
MKVDILPEVDAEVQGLIDVLVTNDIFTQVDEAWVEIKTPFLLNPGVPNKNYEYATSFSIYPELLTYTDPETYGKNSRVHKWVTTPWLCIEMEIEGQDEMTLRKFCRWFKDTFVETSGIHPFKDEDAFMGFFKKRDGKGYSTIKMYVNPDYPKGVWENHVIE